MYYSTDLIDWQPAPQLSVSTTTLFNLGYLSAIYSGNGSYPIMTSVKAISDATNLWKDMVPNFISNCRDVKADMEAASVIFYVPRAVSDSHGTIDAGVYIISSYSSINRVLGHTLYLR
jgi:hypothetical protein